MGCSGMGFYVDVMYYILIYKNWIEFFCYMIVGMIVIVFWLVVDWCLIEELILVYNWMVENFVVVDFIGVMVS